jgi:uncharacterized protein YjbI with pentapeptide repeats
MDLEIIKAEKTATRRPAIRSAKVDLEIILEQHRDWVKSKGRDGRQADLSRLNLEGADLTDTNLQGALLNEAVLKGADLLLTDFQGASLLQANLQGANLLGARLREANLQGANLEGATGLLAAELAGTNLTFAKLPAEVATAEDLKYMKRRGGHAKWLISALLLLNALACWRIVTVSDTQILRNAALLPFPVLRNGVPLTEFFLLCPVLIGALYLWLHVYLQRFWEATSAMPAIFENGRRLDKSLPWIVSWPVTSYFRLLRERRSALAGVEKTICVLLLYWVTPATMTLFWGRYLTLQDLRGTILHAALVAAATTAAIHFPRSAARAFRSDDSVPFSRAQSESRRQAPERPADELVGAVEPAQLVGGLEPQQRPTWDKNGWGKRTGSLRLPIGAGLGLILCLLSIGTIGGAPHGGNAAQGIGAGSPWTWAADALWLAGYDPYARVIEAEISRKPAGWTDSEGETSRVQGANLSGFRLRYLQAYSAFLVKARLRQADLSYAYLSEADLRQANLRQANLRFAAMDQVKLNSAALQSADLERANLIRAELEKADLSFATLAGAVLLDAKLDDAVLYGADLRNAWLERASFEQADLRQANLEGANLKTSDLRGAYLTTAKMAGAKLEETHLNNAILMGADLRHADLSNGNLQGAVLNGADLSGANLQGADLRGVSGLSAGQVCTAANARQAQLDDALATEVTARCSANRQP